jgi:glucose/arabinose dehydrogenase
MILPSAAPFWLALVAPTLAQTFQPFGAPFASPVTVTSGLDAQVLFSNLTAPRGIVFDADENLLVVERGFGVTAFSLAANETGILRTVVIANPNFTQGIQIDGDKLYLSTATDVQRYRYNATSRSVSGEGTVLVTDFPEGGG